MPKNDNKLSIEEKLKLQRKACLSCLPLSFLIIAPATFCITFLVGSLINAYFNCFTLGKEDLSDASFEEIVSTCAIPAVITYCICCTLATVVAATTTFTQTLLTCIMPNTIKATLTPVNELIYPLSSLFFKKADQEENKKPLLSDKTSTEMEGEGNPTSPTQKITRYRFP